MSTTKRYTIVMADRSTGVVRRFTISLWPTLIAVFSVLSLPVLMGLGARWSALPEITQLKVRNASLQLENANYREATGELSGQITSLQAAISGLNEESKLDPAVAKALSRLPAMVRSRATGGNAVPADPSPLFSAALTSPENTFGVLRDLLSVLEKRLVTVKNGLAQQQALAAATPSMWPARGWLTDVFGNRKDPFTGERDFHPALDISADPGQPVYATADGVVESAARSGAYGNLVVLSHGFGMATRYAHLSRFAVKPGAKVHRGEVVGYVGSTGRATGSHLHYEIWMNGRPVNPLRLLGPTSESK